MWAQARNEKWKGEKRMLNRKTDASLKQFQLAGLLPPLRCKCLVVGSLKESRGKASNLRRKVFKDFYSLFSLRLRPQNEPSSEKVCISVWMFKSHSCPHIIHISSSVTNPSLTSCRYTTVHCVFLDVSMSDLDCKLLDQWFLGVWGHRTLENFTESIISLQNAHGHNHVEVGNFLRFRDLLKSIQEFQVENHCLKGKVPCRYVPWKVHCLKRKVPCNPTGLGNNFIFLWVAYTLFWDCIPTFFFNTMAFT